jgi:1-acyl-sn-glycerol-3-phosphate acyltransferase
MRPNPLPLAIRLRSNLFQAPPFLLSTVLYGTLALLVSPWDKPGRLQHRIAQLWARTSVYFSGSRLQVVGLENVPATAAVFASNHTSYMDTPVVFASLPFQFRILAKVELWTVPFIGWYLNRSGQLPISTANPRSTVSSLGAAVKTLRAGMNLFVFPEGGRTPNGQLQTFLNGAAYLAIRAQVPLVPVALVGVYNLLPMHTKHFYTPPRTQPLKLILGTPIPTTNLTLRDADALTTHLRTAIQTLLDQYS